MNLPTPPSAPDVTIVIPVKNESETIALLADEVGRTMDASPWIWETLWIDDGSTDDSLAIMRTLHEEDPRHRYFSFEVNCGQSAAFFEGFRRAGGRIIATLDGDGQNDPADLPSLIRIVDSGRADMANGYRRRRRDSWIRKIASRIANGFRNLTTGKTVRDVGCSTRAFRRECVQDLPRFAGMHRFLPTLVHMNGFSLAEEAVNHRPRRFGRSKYTINNRLWVGLYDAFGVMWLRKRGFRFRVKEESE